VCQPVHSELCEYALRRRPVLDWRLVARQNSPNQVILFYRVKSRDDDDKSEFWGEAAIWVSRVQGTWGVTTYSVEY
jgi:hypothetical protein